MLGKVTRYIGYPAQLSKVKFLELFLPEQILQLQICTNIFMSIILLCFNINLDKFYFYDNINLYLIYNFQV